MSDELRVKYSRTKTLRLIAAGPLVAIAAIIMSVFPVHPYVLRAWALVLLGPLISIFGLVRFFDKRDFLVIDKNGVLDRRIYNETIPWDDIRSIRVIVERGRTYLMLNVDDPLRFMTRGVRRFYRRFIFFGIRIGESALDTTFEEIRRVVSIYADIDPPAFLYVPPANAEDPSALPPSVAALPPRTERGSRRAREPA